jgi:hypothetical protein
MDSTIYNARQDLFNVDFDYRVYTINSILDIYAKADAENRDLTYDEEALIKSLPKYPDGRQDVLIEFNFDKFNIDNILPTKENVLIDAIKIMDNLGGADNKKETFVDYCIGDLHGYKVWYEDSDEPIYTLYYSYVESTTAY